MTELQLHPDEYALLLKLPEDGSPVGNIATKSSLGWSKMRYKAARDGLLAKLLVVRAMGGGGALKRATVAEDSDIDVDSVNGIVTVKPPVAEAKLYAPILEVLKGSWGDDRGFTPIAVENVANLGARKTGGRWTRPDLVAVGVTGFKYVPDRLFEVIVFEVKPVEHINVIAVYEALSHRRAATHAFVLVHVPAVLSEYAQRNVDKVIGAATEHGIGVITFAEPGNYATWNVCVEAIRVDSPPAQVNSFIQNNLSFDSQSSIADAIVRLNGGDFVPLSEN